MGIQLKRITLGLLKEVYRESAARGMVTVKLKEVECFQHILLHSVYYIMRDPST